jgi:hypothetical protein
MLHCAQAFRLAFMCLSLHLNTPDTRQAYAKWVTPATLLNLEYGVSFVSLRSQYCTKPDAYESLDDP